MKFADFNGISLFQMETCVAVAKYKNITKSAEMLHSSEPAISKKITQIEDQLGLTLFVRGKNIGIQTTPVGEYLCSQWSKILIEFRDSFSSACELQENRTSTCVVIATTPSAQSSFFISPLVEEFRCKYPDVEVRVDNCSITEAKRRLCSKEADVVLVTPYLKEIFVTEELEFQTVASCPLSVGMLKTNPLAKRKSLCVEDLKSQQFVLPQSICFIKYITEICKRHGFLPKVSYYAKYFHGISMCIGADDEIFITDRFFQAYYNNSCAYFDLPDTKSGIIMAVRKHETDKNIEGLIAIIVRKMRDLNFTET